MALSLVLHHKEDVAHVGRAGRVESDELEGGSLRVMQPPTTQSASAAEDVTGDEPHLRARE